MDITFKVENAKFNYRVCAMMISDGKYWRCMMNAHRIIIYREEEWLWEKQPNML